MREVYKYFQNKYHFTTSNGYCLTGSQDPALEKIYQNASDKIEIATKILHEIYIQKLLPALVIVPVILCVSVHMLSKNSRQTFQLIFPAM